MRLGVKGTHTHTKKKHPLSERLNLKIPSLRGTKGKLTRFSTSVLAL